jgi:hypothetical protein
MPELGAEGGDNFGWLGMEGGENLSTGVCSARIAGREAILVYASKPQSEQGAPGTCLTTSRKVGGCQNSTPSIHTANHSFLFPLHCQSYSTGVLVFRLKARCLTLALS